MKIKEPIIVMLLLIILLIATVSAFYWMSQKQEQDKNREMPDDEPKCIQYGLIKEHTKISALLNQINITKEVCIYLNSNYGDCDVTKYGWCEYYEWHEDINQCWEIEMPIECIEYEVSK